MTTPLPSARECPVTKLEQFALDPLVPPRGVRGIQRAPRHLLPPLRSCDAPPRPARPPRTAAATCQGLPAWGSLHRRRGTVPRRRPQLAGRDRSRLVTRREPQMLREKNRCQLVALDLLARAQMLALPRHAPADGNPDGSGCACCRSVPGRLSRYARELRLRLAAAWRWADDLATAITPRTSARPRSWEHPVARNAAKHGHLQLTGSPPKSAWFPAASSTCGCVESCSALRRGRVADDGGLLAQVRT